MRAAAVNQSCTTGAKTRRCAIVSSSAESGRAARGRGAEALAGGADIALVCGTAPDWGAVAATTSTESRSGLAPMFPSPPTHAIAHTPNGHGVSRCTVRRTIGRRQGISLPKLVPVVPT